MEIHSNDLLGVVLGAVEGLLGEEDSQHILRGYIDLTPLENNREGIERAFNEAEQHNRVATQAARAATLDLFARWQEVVRSLNTALYSIEHLPAVRPHAFDLNRQRWEARRAGTVAELPEIKTWAEQSTKLQRAVLGNVQLLRKALTEHSTLKGLPEIFAELQDRWLVPAVLLGIGAYLASHLLPSPTDTAITGAAGFMASSNT